MTIPFKKLSPVFSVIKPKYEINMKIGYVVEDSHLKLNNEQIKLLQVTRQSMMGK